MNIDQAFHELVRLVRRFQQAEEERERQERALTAGGHPRRGIGDGGSSSSSSRRCSIL